MAAASHATPKSAPFWVDEGIKDDPEKVKKALDRKVGSVEVPRNSNPAVSEITNSHKDHIIGPTQKEDLAALSRPAKPANSSPKASICSTPKNNDAQAIMRQTPKVAPLTQEALKMDNRSIPITGVVSKGKLEPAAAGNVEGDKKGHRRPKNTVVVSMQMPNALVGVLDEIVDAGGYRSRSDLILQAVRSHGDVSKRLALLKPKRLQKK